MPQFFALFTCFVAYSQPFVLCSTFILFVLIGHRGRLVSAYQSYSRSPFLTIRFSTRDSARFVMPPRPSPESTVPALPKAFNKNVPPLGQVSDSEQDNLASTMILDEATPSRRFSTPRSSSRPMSPREARTSVLGRAFSEYDLDKSGTIDRTEMRLLLQDLGWCDDDDSINRIFCVLDKDSKGFLTYEQFMKWTEFAFASRVLYHAEMFPQSWKKLLPGESVLTEQVELIDEEFSSNSPSQLLSCRSALGVIEEDGGIGENVFDTRQYRSRGSSFNRSYGSRNHSREYNRNLGPSDKCSKPGLLPDDAAKNDSERDGDLGIDCEFGNSSDEATNEFSEHERESTDYETNQTADLIAAERMKHRGHGSGTAKARAKSVGFLCSETTARLSRAEKMGLNREGRATSKLTAHIRWTVEQFLKSSEMIKGPSPRPFPTTSLDERKTTNANRSDNLGLQKKQVGDRSVRFCECVQSSDLNLDESGNELCNEECLRVVRTRKTK